MQQQQQLKDKNLGYKKEEKGGNVAQQIKHPIWAPVHIPAAPFPINMGLLFFHCLSLSFCLINNRPLLNASSVGARLATKDISF